MEIKTEKTAVRPDYRPLARTLLDEIRAYYSNPENEAEFQRWKAEQKRAQHVQS